MINSKKIVSNTLFLYLRMILIMVVSFYAVRVTLNVLGTEDYGIYSVVGGLILIMTFLTDPLSLAVQRYYSYYLGKKDFGRLLQVFNNSILIFFIISVLVFVIGESLGFWFLTSGLNIPANRADASVFIFHVSLITFVVSLLSIPFQGYIISKEKMNIFAYISILETVLKVVVVFLLQYFTFDKLSLYSLLLLGSSIITTSIYIIVCFSMFKELKLRLQYNKEIFKEIFSFISWNVIGGFAYVINNQGVNILFNTQFGPLMNASRGVSMQINGAVNQFALNITKSINPQIVKNYSLGNFDEMNTLVLKGTKITFYLIGLISLPILLFTDEFLNLWLVKVPEKSVIFVQLVIVNLLVECFSNLLKTSIGATGEIRKYQIVIGGILLLNVPITYLFFFYGASPEYAFYVLILTSTVSLFVRLYLLRTRVKLSMFAFIKTVIWPAVRCVLILVPLTYVLLHGFKYLDMNNLLLRLCAVEFLYIMVVLFLGTDKIEKDFLRNAASKIVKKIKK